MLPTDFDIFSAPVRTMPLCIQIRASGTPRAASVCAISFSWWGKTRSEPPLWISKSAPSSFSAIAEHSMCQPGRPSPQGEGQNASSSCLRAFQSAKSSGLSLSSRGARLLALVHLVGVAVGELAVAVEAADAEVDVAAGLVGVPASISVSISSTISAIVSVASGSASGRPSPSRSVSST